MTRSKETAEIAAYKVEVETAQAGGAITQEPETCKNIKSFQTSFHDMIDCSDEVLHVP